MNEVNQAQYGQPIDQAVYNTRRTLMSRILDSTPKYTPGFKYFGPLEQTQNGNLIKVTELCEQFEAIFFTAAQYEEMWMQKNYELLDEAKQLAESAKVLRNQAIGKIFAIGVVVGTFAELLITHL